MQFTPVVPPYPSPGGGSASPLQPPLPVIPQQSPNNPPITPSWGQHPAQFPHNSPYVIPAAFGMGTPGSYFIPPANLPGGTPLVSGQGLSADYTGFPGPIGGGGNTPYTRPGGMPPGTPYNPPGSAYNPPGNLYNAPSTGYSTFQQPLPPYGGYPMGGIPPMPMTTPYMTTQLPPGMPPGMHPGMQSYGMPMGMGFPGYTPAPPPGGMGLPGAAPPLQQSLSNQGRGYGHTPKEKGPWDQLNKFLEGEDYGPVLKPMLVARLKVTVEVNPLIQPPSEEAEHDFLKWSMLFATSHCQRSNDKPGRSWHQGRDAPATWPRVTSLRLISRSFPGTIEVPASQPETGVTCGDVIEAIHVAMYTRLTQAQYDNASRQQQRLLSESFYHNRSTADGVPGGRLQQTLLRCDWLGQDTMFGGIVRDDALVHDVCRSMLPCTFSLLCIKRYPVTEAELRQREEEKERAERRHSRRSRSRATSRAASTRAPTRPPSGAPEEDTASVAS